MSNTTKTKAGLQGRPPKILTAEAESIIETLCESIRYGTPQDMACSLAGISQRTFYYWSMHGKDARAKGERGERLNRKEAAYLDFLQRIERAFAELADRNMKLIQIAANGTKNKPGDWRAAAWILERRIPGQFSPKTETNVNMNGHLSVDMEVNNGAIPARTLLASIFEKFGFDPASGEATGAPAVSDDGTAVPVLSDNRSDRTEGEA